MKLSKHFLSLSLYMGVLVVMCKYRIGVDGGTTHNLNWTVEGVRDYTRTALKTELGDKVIMDCTTYSSLWIQTERTKYDNCNASAGSEKPYQNGFCLDGRQLILTLTMNSAQLQNDINYQNNTTYYLMSFANGNLSSVFDDSGGQCEDGLKMILDIGRPKLDTQNNDKPGQDKADVEKPMAGPLGAENSGGGPTVNGVSIYIVIGAAAGGALVLVLVCIAVITIVAICCCKRSRSKNPRATKSIPGISFYSSPGPDSQACTLTRSEFSLGSQAVSEITTTETIQTQIDDVDANLGTFGLTLKPKAFGSVDILSKKSMANSTATAEKSYDDATGQLSTPFHTNLTPEQKSQSITNVNYAPAHNKGKPKPIPLPRPRQKASSVDMLI